MPRWARWILFGLVAAVLLGATYLPDLRQRINRLRRAERRSDDQARRELTQPAIAAPGDVKIKAKLFWASPDASGELAASEIALPLSGDPVLRAKQVLNTLLAGPSDPDLRTLPPEAVLLEFYLLPDGTGIADFSEDLATQTPSGIESEQMAVESITRTLEANVPQVRRLKILIHGLDTDTLAGHLDLTSFFPAGAQKQAAPAPSQTAAPAPAAPGATAAPASAAPTARPAPPPPAKLTPAPAPGKLSEPVRRP